MFDGDILCKHLKDGEYRFPFLIYREHVRNVSNLSMANEGFAHPCMLKVKSVEGMYASIEGLGEKFGREEETAAMLEEFDTFMEEYQTENEGKESPACWC